jgi:hypothetical protein
MVFLVCLFKSNGTLLRASECLHSHGARLNPFSPVGVPLVGVVRRLNGLLKMAW